MSIKKLLPKCILLFILLILSAGSSLAGELDTDSLYDIEYINEYSKYFTNKVDGYRIMLPSAAEIDMSLSELRAVAETEELRIEIYDQTIGGGFNFNSYTNYGTRILNDTSVYYLSYKGTLWLAGRNAFVTEWARNKLSSLENDRNYYACVHLPITNTRAITLIFKSSVPLRNESGNTYEAITNTLSLVPKSAYPLSFRSESRVNNNWNSETRALFDKYFAPDAKLEWGIYEPGVPLIDKLEFNHLESAIDHKFRFELFYSCLGYDLNNVSTALKNAKEQGRTLELTFQTIAKEGGGNMVFDILNGYYDDYLSAYAKIVAENGAPVLFRPGNEMNGDWCVYSAFNVSMDTELYKAFYRYIYEIFRKNGALENTIWIWNPNDRSYPNFDWNHALCYYPGDEYVDIVGLTGYNTGTYYRGERWRSFNEIYDAFYYNYCAWFSQPFMITEFACSAIGGDQAYWIGQMFLNIGNYDRIKLAIWWNGYDYDKNGSGNVSRHYSIKENAEAQLYFKYNLTESEEPEKAAEIELPAEEAPILSERGERLKKLLPSLFRKAAYLF